MQSLEGNSNVSSILNGHYKRRENAVKKCYQAALSLGFRVFAVQDGGQCFRSTTYLPPYSYKTNGPSTACLKDGAGGPMANEVYKMVDGECCANLLVLHAIKKYRYLFGWGGGQLIWKGVT